jgi:hypothetical protein
MHKKSRKANAFTKLYELLETTRLEALSMSEMEREQDDESRR